MRTKFTGHTYFGFILRGLLRKREVRMRRYSLHSALCEAFVILFALALPLGFDFEQPALVLRSLSSSTLRQLSIFHSNLSAPWIHVTI